MADVSDSFLVINDVIKGYSYVSQHLVFIKYQVGPRKYFSFYVYTWIFQNLVSKIINSFYYLAI